jgi:hypothetical protein
VTDARAVPVAGGEPGGEGRYRGGVTEDHPDSDVHDELEYLRRTPAQDLLANHYFVLAQWAAVHLAASPADLAGAQLVIDVMSALLDAGDGRLGEHASLYRTALAEIQQVYVRASLAGEREAPAPTPSPEASDNPGTPEI